MRCGFQEHEGYACNMCVSRRPAMAGGALPPQTPPFCQQRLIVLPGRMMYIRIVAFVLCAFTCFFAPPVPPFLQQSLTAFLCACFTYVLSRSSIQMVQWFCSENDDPITRAFTIEMRSEVAYHRILHVFLRWKGNPKWPSIAFYTYSYCENEGPNGLASQFTHVSTVKMMHQVSFYTCFYGEYEAPSRIVHEILRRKMKSQVG